MSVQRRPQILLSAFLALQTVPLSAETWSNFYDDWNNLFSWNGFTSIPDGVGAVANFSTTNYTSKNEVYLAQVRTIGSLQLGDTTAPIFQTLFLSKTPGSGGLIFDNGGAGATIATIVSTTPPPTGYNRPPDPANYLDIPVVLNDDLSISVNTGPSTSTTTPWIGVFFDETVTETGGSRSITFDGNGRGITAFNNSVSFTGGAIINTGSVQMGIATDLGSGPITVNSGGQARWYSSRTTSNDLSIKGNGFAEPEGTRGALLFHGGIHNVTGSLLVASNSRIEGTTNTVTYLRGPLTGSNNLEINALTGGTFPESRNGTFHLDGDASAFTGEIKVSRGQLELGQDSNPGGDLGVSIAGTISGETTIAGNLKLGTPAPLGTTSTLYVNPISPEILHANGDLNLSNVTTVILNAIPPTGNTTILTYGGSLSGSPANLELLGGIANYRTGTAFDTTSTPGAVELNIVRGDLVWNGATSNDWSTSATNWAGGDNFHQLDDVTFDDSKAGGGVVTVLGTILAGTIHVNNSIGNDYIIESDAGNTATPTGNQITTGSLIKDGTGSLIMGSNTGSRYNRHSFSGGTTLNDGRIIILQGGDASKTSGSLGTGQITINGGALSAQGPLSLSLFNDLRINADTTLGQIGQTIELGFRGKTTLGTDLVIDIASTVGFGKGNDPNTGVSDNGNGYNLTKTGVGVLDLANGSTNSWSGTTTISDGNLRIRGQLSCGHLTAQSGSTLSGDGTLTASVTIESGGTITAENNSTNIMATTMNISGDVEINGSYLCELDDEDADRINVSGELDISTATLHINVLKPLVDEEAIQIIATYGSLAGTSFAIVNGLPANRALNYHYNDGSGSNHIAITPILTPYQNWANSRGLVEGVNAAPNDDPNHDGASNLEHFAFDTDPLGNGSSEGKQRLKLATDGGSEQYLTVTVPILKGTLFSGSPLIGPATFGNYEVWGDNDLIAPFDLTVVEVTPALSAGLPPLGDYDSEPGPDWQYRTFRLADPIPNHNNAFIKFSASEAP